MISTFNLFFEIFWIWTLQSCLVIAHIQSSYLVTCFSRAGASRKQSCGPRNIFYVVSQLSFIALEFSTKQFFCFKNELRVEIIIKRAKVHAIKTCSHNPLWFQVDIEEGHAIVHAENVRIVPTFKIYKKGIRVKEMICPSPEVLESSVRHYSI